VRTGLAGHELTLGAKLSYDPAWSPVENVLAFVSQLTGNNDEVFRMNGDGTGMRQLTVNSWEWDKHPTWSPDGKQIAFFSNRHTGRLQIWVMDSDGRRVRNISNNEYNDWEPVWLK
jgi:TolB protein